jgi:3-dehydroquinate dehydratase/shikimate dehydrogenase
VTQLCITVTGGDADTIRRERIAAEAHADLVELRVDFMERPDAAAALAGRRKPAIVTCRPVREGGNFSGAEEERVWILEQAHAHGAEFIDVEWDTDCRRLIAARQGRGVIVSKHQFGGGVRDIARVLEQLRAAGGEMAKLAVVTESLTDVRRLLSARHPGGDTILIGMGSAGLCTRVLAARFGSPWTYAGQAVAPGQIPASRLLDEFHFRRVREDAAVYGVVGHPAVNSLSPAMHNAGFAALGLNAVYVPLDVPDVDDFRGFAEAIGLRGASVTIPFKQDVLALLDDVTVDAETAGAVNTVAIRGGRWIGSNTDADGFLEPLGARGIDLRGARAVLLGAGGSARGVGLALTRQGARVAIAARRREAAEQVAQAVGASVAAWPPEAGSWDLLVNATPLGSRAMPGVPFEGPFDGRLVYDLNYDPDPTELMQRARRAGMEVIGGLAMLVAQAERQFEFWTGRRPPAGLFAGAAARAVNERMEWSERRSATGLA